MNDSSTCPSSSGAGEWILTYQVEQRKRLQASLRSTVKTCDETGLTSLLAVPENTPASYSARQRRALTRHLLVRANLFMFALGGGGDKRQILCNCIVCFGATINPWPPFQLKHGYVKYPSDLYVSDISGLRLTCVSSVVTS